MEKDLKRLLLDALQGNLDAEERQRLASALYPEPDAAFGRRVRNRLQQQQSLSGRIVELFPRVVAACLVLFLLSIVATYLSSGTLTSETIIGIQDLTIEDAYVYLTE